jgi:DNA ligase-1
MHAPSWWTAGLPKFFVDGELWMGYGRFQELRSEVASQDGDWDQVQFKAFGCPNSSVLEPRKISVRSDYKFEIKELGSHYDAARHLAAPITWGFSNEITRLKTYGENEIFRVVLQQEIPYVNTEEFINYRLETVLDKGGEGLMFRNATMPWEAHRSKYLLKYKPYFDCEVTITGYTSGKETDRGSKHLGKIGALITDYQGKRLKVSGLTDVEREFDLEFIGQAINNPGSEIPGARAVHFEVGQEITIRYRELSDDGIPKEARYWRKRD